MMWDYNSVSFWNTFFLTRNVKFLIDLSWTNIEYKLDVAGAKSVEVDLKQQKATVTGYVEAKKVLKAAQSTKKKVELWPYVPYTLVAHPYVAQAYDKKAPPNMVRKVPDTATISETTMDDQYIHLFNDDNPNACCIM